MFRTQALREIDRRAVEQFGIPSIVLMENAALSIARVAFGLMSAHAVASTIVMAGPGNNGGDGFALARHLHNRSHPVIVLHTRPVNAYTGDARTNLEIIRAMRIRTIHADSGARYTEALAEMPGPHLIVDALLGTGTDRPASGVIADVIDHMNSRTEDLVLAVDIPSGMDADRGPVLGACVRADVTVTLVGWKVGMTTPQARNRLGEVIVGDIGAPRELVDSRAQRCPC